MMKMLKKILMLTLVLTLLTTSLIFADGTQSILSKVTGLSDDQITTLNQNHGGFGRVLTASIVAKLTNSSVEDILKAKQDGATFFEIAKNKGIELDQYKEAIQDGKAAYIDEQVKAGVITEDQGKIIKERLTQQIENCDGLGNGLGKGNCSGMRGFGRENRARGNGMRTLFNQ
jgi:hypothetical protein